MSEVLELCEVAKIPYTKRQQRKFSKGFGMARHAQPVLDAKRRMEGSQARVAVLVAELESKRESLDYPSITAMERLIEFHRLGAESARMLFEEAKLNLPKYSPHKTNN